MIAWDEKNNRQPNATTTAAIDAADRGEVIGPFETVEEMMALLNEEDRSDGM